MHAKLIKLGIRANISGKNNLFVLGLNHFRQTTNLFVVAGKFLLHGEQNYFQGLEINFKGTKIYFQGFEIYFQTTEKVFIRGVGNLSPQREDFVSAEGGF